MARFRAEEVIHILGEDFSDDEFDDSDSVDSEESDSFEDEQDEENVNDKTNDTAEVGGTRMGICPGTRRGVVRRRGAVRGRGRGRCAGRGRGIGVTVPDYHWIVVGADKLCSS